MGITLICVKYNSEDVFMGKTHKRDQATKLPSSIPLTASGSVSVSNPTIHITAAGHNYQGTGVRDFVQNNNGSVVYVRIDKNKTTYLYERYKAGSIIYVTTANGDVYTLVQGTDYSIENDRAVLKNSNNANTTASAVANDRNKIPEFDTMLYYIVKKNGGTSGWNTANTVLTVEMNGYKKTYDINKLVIRDGRAIMASKKIAEDFRLSGANTFHAIYDLFDNMDDAAKAFSFTYVPWSKRIAQSIRMEYTSGIYQNRNGKLLFGYAQKGTKNGGYYQSVYPTWDDNLWLVSFIHTHPYKQISGDRSQANNPDNLFGYIDTTVFSGYWYKGSGGVWEGDAIACAKWGRPIYMVNVDVGDVLRLDPAKLSIPEYKKINHQKYIFNDNSAVKKVGSIK